MPAVEQSAALSRRARVLAVDDDVSFLALLRELVRATAHLEIAAEAQSGEQAIVAAQELRPDIVLLDIRMPGMGGMKAAELIKAADRATVIAMISTTHPNEIPPKACEKFADAVLWKSTLEPRTLDEVWLHHGVHPGSDGSLEASP